MCICFQAPRPGFRSSTRTGWNANDYRAWEDLIEQLVRHYRQKSAGIQYWEVANEPDIGEDGGCP